MTARRLPEAGRWPALIALACAALIFALFLGVADVPAAAVLDVLAGRGAPAARSIILDIRLPRIVVGALAGIHFALAGLLLQTVTRNPLADPSVMGISQGATLAVTLFLLATAYSGLAGPSVVVRIPVAWLPLVGTLGGLLAGGAVHAMAARHALGPLRITLCGIALGAVLHALSIGLIAGWGSSRLEVLLEWLSGSLYARGWDHALFLLPFTLAGLAVLPLLRRPLALLRLDAPVAASFGLAYPRYFSLVLFLACGLAASAVGAVGPVVFVGLVVPHLARALAGGRAGAVMPLTIVLGVLVVTLADLAGRLLGGAEEIPIGVVTALCGAPLLVLLLRRMP